VTVGTQSVIDTENGALVEELRPASQRTEFTRD